MDLARRSGDGSRDHPATARSGGSGAASAEAPAPAPRPAALDAATMRFLERHETFAHAVGGREVRDLGDALLLHDAADRDPFWNRVGATDLPADEDAFDRRLRDLLVLFATLDRRPHIVLPPLHASPPDLAARLTRHGFHDLGGGLVMVLTDPTALDGIRLPDRLRLDRHVAPPAASRRRLAEEIASLLIASFQVDPAIHGRLVDDLLRSFDAPQLAIHIVRAGQTVVAVAKQTSFDGATYLSSIGTRPGWQGRGIGAAITAAACRSGAAAGHPLTYLGVFGHNVRARLLYERLGFAAVGGRTGDFLLR